MKTCNECGTFMPDDVMVCPKCGAPQPQNAAPVPPVYNANPTPPPTPTPTPNPAPNPYQVQNPNYTRVTPSNQNVWESPIFAILPFAAAVLFLLGTFIFLIRSFDLAGYFGSGLVFGAIFFFLAALINVVATLPKLIKMISK